MSDSGHNTLTFKSIMLISSRGTKHLGKKYALKVTSLMNPQPNWVSQNQTHKIHLFPVSFIALHQHKPSCKLGSYKPSCNLL